MSSIKKEFAKQLKSLDVASKDVIESFTNRCTLHAAHAKEITEAIFQEFKEVCDFIFKC
jgi:hypothetical protein